MDADWQRGWRLRNKDKLRAKQAAFTERMTQIKQASGCVDCGYNGEGCALDFDHVRGTKLFSIAMAWNRRADLVEAEIAKCEVVCANCHRIRTRDRLRARALS